MRIYFVYAVSCEDAGTNHYTRACASRCVSGHDKCVYLDSLEGFSPPS